jgi:adenylate cyclase
MSTLREGTLSLFAELKRRNVFRVGIAYLIGAWLLLQISDVVLNNIAAPEWVFKAIMLLLGIGLPIALFFAWAFELTPDGIKLEKDVDREQSITRKTSKKLNHTITVILVLALGYFIIDKFSAPAPVHPEASAVSPVATVEESPKPKELSIAVLPFVNMSADPEQEFFSDGISEELLNLLVRVDGLKVASRTSSFSYKGESLDIPEIASKLKVNHILEGSVRKAGNRVRITAQLIETTSDRHLWSDTFDRELVDIFAIQDEIANAIVTALKGELGVGEKAVSVKAATENLDAYELYLKARGLFVARQNLLTSIELYEQAIELDPGFARAWEGLAAAQSVTESWHSGDGIDHQTLALAAAEHALELDPSLSMPHAVLGMAMAHDPEIELSSAITQLDQSVNKDTKNATALLWRGIALQVLGYLDAAVADFQNCLEIDTGYLNCKQHLAVAFLGQGKEAEAIRLYEETIEENFHSTDEAFVWYYVRSDQRTAALLLADIMTRSTYAPVKDWIRAIEYPQEDHADKLSRFQTWAERTNENLNDYYAILLALNEFKLVADKRVNAGRYLWHPEAKAFRKTEEFKQYVRENLMDYWLANGYPNQCRPLGEEDFECD